jgi:hypothetical protein
MHDKVCLMDNNYEHLSLCHNVGNIDKTEEIVS